MKVKVKRSGTIFIGVTIFLGVAAANTGNNLLYIVVSAMLSLMLVSGISSLLNLKNLEISLVPPLEVYAGRRSPFRLLIRKRGRLPSFLLRIGSGADDVLLPVVGSSTTEERIDLIFPQRGKVDGVILTVSSDFPLGMFVRSAEVKVPLEVVVFPEPVETSLIPFATPTGSEGSAPELSTTKGYEEFRDIREYAGEPMKLIHWKASAKLGSLMVREMVSEEKEPVILTLESVDGDLETKLSKLTYLISELIRRGYPVGLKLKDKEIPPDRGEHQKLLMLTELALY